MMKRFSTSEEDVMAEIMAKVSEMVALDIDRDTIRFFVITRVGEAQWGGLDKVLFIGAMEEALDRIGVKI